MIFAGHLLLAFSVMFSYFLAFPVMPTAQQVKWRYSFFLKMQLVLYTDFGFLQNRRSVQYLAISCKWYQDHHSD